MRVSVVFLLSAALSRMSWLELGGPGHCEEEASWAQTGVQMDEPGPSHLVHHLCSALLISSLFVHAREKEIGFCLPSVSLYAEPPSGAHPNYTGQVTHGLLTYKMDQIPVFRSCEDGTRGRQRSTLAPTVNAQ